LVSGAVIQKSRPVPFLIFIFLWSTFVYDPIARWTWNHEGWSFHWGSLDFAGGTGVHICAASTAAIYSIFPKIRGWKFNQQLPDFNAKPRPCNVVSVVLGTSFLWVGWFGFNGGSALGANLRAASACYSTHLAACTGGFWWCFLDYIISFIPNDPHNPPQKRFSIIGFCNGAVTGLVAITPAAGYVCSCTF
jgi:Amt family ammonium transporter